MKSILYRHTVTASKATTGLLVSKIYIRSYSILLQRNEKIIADFEQRFSIADNAVLKKVNHINLKDATGYDNFKGQTVIRKISPAESQKSVLKIASHQESSRAYKFALGGLDFDEPAKLSALLKVEENLRNVLPSLSLAEINRDDDAALAIFPAVSRQVRYDAAMQYSFNSKYFPQYIVKMIEDHILPKINYEDTMFMPATQITFFSYSLGGREVMMIENALKFMLPIYGLNQTMTKIILSNFKAVCLAYAADYEHINTESGFAKLIMHAVEDSGVLKPKNLVSSITSHDVVKKDFSILKMVNQDNIESFLMYLGYGSLPHLHKEGSFSSSHALPLYVEAIKKTLPIDVQLEISQWLSLKAPSALDMCGDPTETLPCKLIDINLQELDTNIFTLPLTGNDGI